jgi:hypothetical protein
MGTDVTGAEGDVGDFEAAVKSIYCKRSDISVLSKINMVDDDSYGDVTSEWTIKLF